MTSRAVPDVPTDSASSNNRRAAAHGSQADVVSEQEMHAEHVAALEMTLFCKRNERESLVLSLESEGFRVMSTATDRREPTER